MSTAVNARGAALFLAAAAALAACDGRNAPAPAQQPAQEQPAPRECSGQPCCGDPPRPCGQVTEEATGADCRTACDCRPGLACHQGRCASGTVAVFCCGACPAGAPPEQACQRRDGSVATCGKPAPDP